MNIATRVPPRGKHDSHDFVIGTNETSHVRLENFLEVAKFFATLRTLRSAYLSNPQALRRKWMGTLIALITSMKDVNLQTIFEVL